MKIQEKELLIEYLESKRVTEKMIEDCTDDGELKILRSILNELKFIIEWLKCGHNPTDYRGIERIQTYLTDPQVIEAVISESLYDYVSEDSYEDYIYNADHKIGHVLRVLTSKELEVFIMITCEKMSRRQIGELFGIKRTSVQSCYERAKKKLEKELINTH